MRRFALWVEFDVRPDAVERFVAAARLDAEGATTREPGCRRFDVLLDPARPTRVWFYEIYDDEAAFEAHKMTPHFTAFGAATQELVVARTVTRLVVEEGGAMSTQARDE